MPIQNDSSDNHMKNAGTTANVFEAGHVTPTVGTGREMLKGAGQNNGGFENRASQEQGQH